MLVLSESSGPGAGGSLSMSSRSAVTNGGIVSSKVVLTTARVGSKRNQVATLAVATAKSAVLGDHCRCHQDLL